MLGKAVVQVLTDAALLAIADFEDFLFQAFAFGDVPGEPREKTTGLQLHFAHGQVHWKTRSILALPHHFAANPDDPGFSSAKVRGDVSIVLLAIRHRHEHTDISTQDLAGLVAKDFLCRCVK